MTTLELVKTDAGYWVVQTSQGKWFGLGMDLDKQGAGEIMSAMKYAFTAGMEAKSTEIKRALGV